MIEFSVVSMVGAIFGVFAFHAAVTKSPTSSSILLASVITAILVSEYVHGWPWFHYESVVMWTLIWWVVAMAIGTILGKWLHGDNEAVEQQE